MLLRGDQEFQLYRHGETVGPFDLEMFVPLAGGTPILLVKDTSYYLITRIGHWNHGLVEIEIVAKFSDRDAAIVAYRLSGGV